MPKTPYSTRILTFKDYPENLQNIHRPPASLHIAGDLPPTHYKYLCVIGSRTFSTYGRDACKKIITGLAGYPICIVSGLALGIDSLAHEAALEAGLPTIAFPGSGLGLNVLYPSMKRKLALRILEHGGALVSEYEHNQIGAYWTFPNRNRLMAGISHAVLIIEARRGSGTLGTAKYAEDFNRDLMAVPGDINSELSYGPHMLIQRGAAMITCAEDILEALGFGDPIQKELISANPKDSNQNYHSRKQRMINLDELNLTPEEKKICSFLKIEKLSATDLIEKTGLSSSQLNILISELEMKGLVKEEGGRYGVK